VSPKRVLTSPAAAWLAAAIGAWVVAAACRTLQPAPVTAASAAGAPVSPLDQLVSQPVVRVGILTDVERVSIGAGSDVTVYGRVPGEPGLRVRQLPCATFRPAAAPGRIRLLEANEELELATVAPPAPSEPVRADASAYRGLLEVRRSGDAALTVVNVVNLEDYLRGVVPNELSPEAFPKIEALKAQAVAARTYALAHLGDFASRGYDLCATQSCQVYRGRSSEQELTDRAVAETRGVLATWRGRPINAYYTSTCGGHTEEGSAIFDDDEPYLHGVACLPERSARYTLHTTSAPRHELPGPPQIMRDLALLEALGVIAPAESDPSSLRGVPRDGEIQTWIAKLLAALHRRGCESPVSGALARRGTFAQHLVASVCWRERAERLLGPADPEYLLQAADASKLDGDGERQAMALLVHEGLVSPQSDNTLRPDAALTRGEALALLAGVAEKAGAPGLAQGEFAGLAGGQVSILHGESADSHPLDPGARLFRNLEGASAGTTDVTLAAGDHVRYVAREGRVVFLEVDQTRQGAAADRASRYYSWEVRLTPEDVARAVGRYGSVGVVRDLVPRRLGVSGRVVELGVEGTTGELILRGLKVRFGLGLRENLFVINRETDARGAVERFIITGKGWGHGVGLCQVGAFGMALAGSTYEQILKHYYTGVQLVTMGAASAAARF
jgi:stage II sporulation protein D